MEHATEREMGHLFGLVGGILVLAGGLFATAFGITNLVMGQLAAAGAALGGAVVLYVVGGLILLFAHLADHGWQGRPVACGAMLVVLAIVSWVALGFGASVLALIGGIFALLAGVLYLVEPTQRAASAIVSTG
jgi:hypothetical protein